LADFKWTMLVNTTPGAKPIRPVNIRMARDPDMDRLPQADLRE
jgi:hypothetical protein